MPVQAAFMMMTVTVTAAVANQFHRLPRIICLGGREVLGFLYIEFQVIINKYWFTGDAESGSISCTIVSSAYGVNCDGRPCWAETASSIALIVFSVFVMNIRGERGSPCTTLRLVANRPLSW